MHRPFTAALAILALAAAVPAVAADFEGVLDSRMALEGKQPMTGTGRMFLSRTGFRMDVQMAAPAGRGGPGEMKVTTMALRSRPGVAYLVNDARKTYSEVDARKAPPQDGTAEKYTVRKIGQERVAGYECVHAVATGDRGDEVEVWTTKDLGSAADYWAAQNHGPRARAALPDALKAAGVDGWPMRWKQKAGADGVMTWEVTKVERKAVPASLFDLSGYTRTEGGVMGGASQMQLSPDQQKQVDGAMQRRQEALDKLPPDQRKRVEEMMKSMGK